MAHRKNKAQARGKYDRTQTTEERREAQRARLLDAASEVFSSRGFAAASVERIVEVAGMSRRTFYEHFDDLYDMLFQLHEQSANFTFRLIEEKVRAEPDPLARLRVGIEAFLSVLAEHGDLARVIFREVRAAGPRYETRHQAALARYVGLLFEGVADAFAKGVATRAPDELTIFALVSALEAVAMRYLDRREEARAIEAAPALFELVARAFR